jgi:hypothetical protein
MQPNYKTARTAGAKVFTDPDHYKADEVGWAPYFVSALASDGKLMSVPNSMNYGASIVDVVMHLAIWVIALVFEVMVWQKADDLKSATPSDTRTFPFALASLVCFIVSISIIVLSTLLHMFTESKITPGNYFPFLTAIVEGGLMSSLIFTLICVLYTVKIDSASDEWRDQTIVLLIMKAMAMSFINANVRRALNRES